MRPGLRADNAHSLIRQFVRRWAR